MKLKEIIDQGRDAEDVRPGATARQMSSVSGPSLSDMVLAHCERNNGAIDRNQLDSDFSFIFIDEAKIGS